MVIPSAYLSYWCHLYFLGIAFICIRNLVCLELENLSCCLRISECTTALGVIRMKEFGCILDIPARISSSDYLLHRGIGLSAPIQTDHGVHLC